MPLRRLYHSLTCARAAWYSACGSSSFGITWTIVTFLGGLLYLIYDGYKRQIVKAYAKRTSLNSNP